MKVKYKMKQSSEVIVTGKTTKGSSKALLAVFYIVIILSTVSIWRLFEHEIFLTKQTRFNVLILAPARSGSSFLGEIFNQHHEIFYLYEPLHAYSILEKLRVLQTTELKQQSYKFLQDAFQCNFTDHRLYLYLISNPGFSPAHFRYSSQALSTPPLCNSQEVNYNPSSWSSETKQAENVCKNRLETNATSFVCRSRKQVAIKVLSHRLSLQTVQRHLIHSDKFDVKVIQLVRDPRAIVNSRITLGWISPNADVRAEIRGFCDIMNENIDYSKKMSSAVPGKYLILRYEDLAKNSLQVAKKLFEQVGLELTENVEQWIVRNTRSSTSRENEKLFSPFATRGRDSRKTMNSWRGKISMEVARTVEENCEPFMREAGYQKVIDENQLRRENLSLLGSPSKSVVHLFFT